MRGRSTHVTRRRAPKAGDQRPAEPEPEPGCPPSPTSARGARPPGAPGAEAEAQRRPYAKGIITSATTIVTSVSGAPTRAKSLKR